MNLDVPLAVELADPPQADCGIEVPADIIRNGRNG